MARKHGPATLAHRLKRLRAGLKSGRFKRDLEEAFQDAKAGPVVKRDPDTGRTIQPEGLQYEELPTTNEAQLSGKGLVESIRQGRPLGDGWVRIAEDTPYTGPIIRITRKPRFFLVEVAAEQVTMEDLTAALKEKFGVERWPPLVIQMQPTRVAMTSPLVGDEKDQMIDMMAGQIARLEIENERLKQS